ncbi:MAG: DnaB-like helicase C-terminal domain-containing protein, partial [Bacteroidaceae bacterium]|nr:DnaB-like helicase C-terminal domain-containing protein [Bacteroidaceae bacterium]
NAAVQANTPVVVFSLEMSKEQCANRILCSQAMVDSQRVGKVKLMMKSGASLQQLQVNFQILLEL